MIKRVAICAALIICVSPAKADEFTKTAFKQADSAEINGQYPLAIRLYQELITTISKGDPKSPRIDRARARIARLHLLQGDFDSATPFVKAILASDQKRASEDPELMVDIDDLSNDYLKLSHDKDHGLPAMMRSCRLRLFISSKHPHLPENYKALSEYELTAGRYDNAILWLEKALTIEAGYPRQKMDRMVQDLIRLAAIYDQKKDRTRAYRTLDKALEVATTSGVADHLTGQCYMSLGRLYMLDKNYKTAQEKFRKAADKLKSCPREHAYARKILAVYVSENERLLSHAPQTVDKKKLQR